MVFLLYNLNIMNNDELIKDQHKEEERWQIEESESNLLILWRKSTLIILYLLSLYSVVMFILFIKDMGWAYFSLGLISALFSIPGIVIIHHNIRTDEWEQGTSFYKWSAGIAIALLVWIIKNDKFKNSK